MMGSLNGMKMTEMSEKMLMLFCKTDVDEHSFNLQFSTNLWPLSKRIELCNPTGRISEQRHKGGEVTPYPILLVIG